MQAGPAPKDIKEHDKEAQLLTHRFSELWWNAAWTKKNRVPLKAIHGYKEQTVESIVLNLMFRKTETNKEARKQLKMASSPTEVSALY